MRAEAVELLLRKQRLQWTIAQQRDDWQRSLHQLDAAAASLDAVLQPLQSSVRRLRAQPLLLIAAAAAMLLWRPRRVWSWGRRGWMLYLGFKQLQQRLRKTAA